MLFYFQTEFTFIDTDAALFRYCRDAHFGTAFYVDRFFVSEPVRFTNFNPNELHSSRSKNECLGASKFADS
jgi:hypothetical protein